MATHGDVEAVWMWFEGVGEEDDAAQPMHAHLRTKLCVSSKGA